MIELVIGAIVGYAAGVFSPYLKKLIQQLCKKGFEKLQAEIKRWK